MNLSAEEEALRVDVFWEELQTCRIEQVEEAFQWARGSLTFFPKPVELLNHIIGAAGRKYQEKDLIEWMGPTEEGRKAALKVLDGLKERWAKEDEVTEAKRKIEFEKNRGRLKKQARLLLKGVYFENS